MDMDADNLTESFRKFEKSWNEAGQNGVDKAYATLRFVRLTNKGEVRISVPNVLSQVNVKGVWIIVSPRIPISALFLWIYYVTLKDFLVGINQSAILYSAQLLFVDIINLGADMAVI